MSQTTCNNCGAEVYRSEKHTDEGAEVYCSEACAAARSTPARRYWRIERLMRGDWLTTDFHESGTSEADALANAQRIARVAGWEGVRLGRELNAAEKNHYCAFAWVNAN